MPDLIAKEENKMAEKRILNEDELKNVNGGASRTVNTGTTQPAVVRSGAGLNYSQIASLPGGTQVNTTGNVSVNGIDGITWFEISDPVCGWIAGNVIGF